MAGRRHFPPSEAVVLARSAFFPGRRTSQQYLPRSEEVRSIFGDGIEWKTNAAAQAAGGPARTGDRIRARKPAVSRGPFVEILSGDPVSDEFAQAARVSWTFLLLVQSECLPLEKSMPHERMGGDSVLNAPAVIGMWGGST